MRWAAKTDANQAEIVAALRAMGATVQPLHAVGKGCPDLLVGFRGVNHLIEVKDFRASAKDRRLRDTQEDWHAGWKGRVSVAETPEAAMAIVAGLAIKGPIS